MVSPLAIGRPFFAPSVTAMVLLLTSFSALVLTAGSVSATAHSPIYISGDSQFTPENGVVGGNGTAENPYLIDGWEIDGSYGNAIVVEHTRAHFVIRNVSIFSYYYYYYDYTVRFYDVTNATVEDSTLYSNYLGLYAAYTSGLTISNVTFDSMYYGAQFDYSDNVTVRGSTVSNCWNYGIIIPYSRDVVVENNTFVNSGSYGVYSYGGSRLLVTGNNFTSTSYAVYLEGMEYVSVVANHMSSVYYPAMVYSSSGVLLSGNEVTYGTYGMYLYYCSDCEVSDNTLLYLSYHQVSLQYCTDTVVSGNVIVDTDDYYWNSEDSAIDIYSCERTVIVGNDISGVADTYTGYVGIYVQMAEDTLIEDNSIASRYAGVVMGYFFNYYSGYWTNDTRILNNSMDDVGYGVYANGYEYYGTPYLQSNLTISGNDFGADYYGAYANMARHVDVVSNTVSTEWGSGFGVYSSVDVDVSDNVFAEGETGLYIGSSVDVIVSGNNFSDCRRGAEIYEAGNLTVVDNQFLRDAHRGLRMSYVVDAYLSGNVFESDGILIEGYSLEHFASHEIPTDNTVNGLPVYYYKDLDGFVFDGVEAGQLIFANCTDVAVSNLDIADTDVAVELGFVTSGLFQDITTTGTDHAFYTYGVTDVTVTRLTAIGDFDYDDDDWEDILFYDQESTNLTITDSTMSDGYRGLQSYESTGLFVEDNLLESNYQGIMLDGTQGAYISQNSVVESRYYGLRSYYMSDSEVSGNTLSFGEYGMYLYSSSDSNVTDNVLYNNMYGLRTYYTYGMNYSHNTVTSNWEYGFESQYPSGDVYYGNTVAENGQYGIWMYSPSSVSVLGNDILSNGYGLYIQEGYGTAVAGNTFDSNWEGIHTESNDYLSASGNLFTENRVGLMAQWSYYQTVEGNTFDSNWDALYLDGGNDYTIVRNDLVRNGYRGVFMFDSGDSLIAMNNISGSYAGIQLFSSYSVEVYANNVSSNENGVYLAYSEDVAVYNNNFVGNIAQAYDSEGDENSWDMGYPEGGNYWSEYDGVDEYGGEFQDEPGPDGIGDTPHVIDGDTQDRYPFFLGLNNNFAPVALFTVSDLYGGTSTLFTADASVATDFEDGTDVLEVRWDWDGDGSWDVDWSTDKSAGHTYSAPGIYTLVLEVRDSGGLTDMFELEVAVDDEAPSTAVSYDGTEGSSGYFVSEVGFSLSPADDYSGVEVTMYSVDQGRWEAYDGEVTVSGEGPHTIEFYSVDRSGNAEPVQSSAVMIDTLSPVTRCVVSGVQGEEGWLSGDVSVALSAEDATSGVASILVSVDGSAWSAYHVPIALDDGVHEVLYMAVDAAGNNGTEGSTTVNVDSTAPVPSASVVGITDGVVSDTTVWIDVSGADATSGLASLTVSVDGSAFEPPSASSLVLEDMSEGSHLVVLRATDVAGNMAETMLAFEVDTEEGGGLSTTAMLLVLGVAAVAALFLLAVVLFIRMMNPRNEDPGAPPSEEEP